jgi:hypothetical protein
MYKSCFLLYAHSHTDRDSHSMVGVGDQQWTDRLYERQSTRQRDGMSKLAQIQVGWFQEGYVRRTLEVDDKPRTTLWLTGRQPPKPECRASRIV